MANQVTGRVYVKVDGQLLRSKDGAKLKFGNIEREAVVGNTVHGYVEKAVAPSIECTISHMADTSLTALQALADATVTFETDTGKNYILRNAWVSKQLELTGGQGELTLEFMGKTCEEA